MKYWCTRERGFTLIELLIVAAIISILAGVVWAQLWRGSEAARDAKRYADLRQIEVALEAYAKTYDRYPSAADGSCTYTTSFDNGGCLEALINAGFFGELPVPPKNSKYEYYYDNWCRDPSGTSDTRYRLWTHGEGDNDGLEGNWWYENTIGVTPCADPT